VLFVCLGCLLGFISSVVCGCGVCLVCCLSFFRWCVLLFRLGAACAVFVVLVGCICAGCYC